MALPTAVVRVSLADGRQHLPFLKDAPRDTSFLPFQDLLLPVWGPLVLMVTGKGRRREGCFELIT